MQQSDKVRVAVVGATGYTGAELLRLLHVHPRAEVAVVAGYGKAGQKIASVLPSFHGVLTGDVVLADPAVIAESCQAAFCGLPHGTSAPIVRELRAKGVVVFDLSADFRLKDLSVYREWYGEHGAPELNDQAVYGLPEFEREAIAKADLVAVPGCYPTATALALAPLVKGNVIDLDSIIVDAKSGASGAGRGLGESVHFAHLSEGFRAYKVGGLHRHTPEIEQTLSKFAERPLRITFTPHLVPMIRGILSTSYARLVGDVSRESCTELARAMYEGSPSVTVLEPGENPDTSWVKGSNRCFISYTVDKRTGRVIAQAAIDNLVKGASGQAIQCFNLRFGLPEAMGLEGVGTFPVMRVLHFSDVHVQEAVSAMPVAELMGKRLLAARNLWLTRGRLFREVPEKLQALAEFARAEQADFVICTGDHTALGSEAEYVAARRTMEPFIQSPLGFCTVPGNHDLYLADTLRQQRFERHFGDQLHSALPEFAVDGAFPFVRLVGEQLAVVGVNSAKPNPSPFSSAGHIPEQQLAALEQVLAHEALAGRWIFVITHYGILKPDGKPDSAHHGLANAHDLLRICTRPRVALLHGHIHHCFSHSPTSEHPWLFCAGSATHRGREGLWLYEFEGARVRAIPGRWDRKSYKLEHSQRVNLGVEGP